MGSVTVTLSDEIGARLQTQATRSGTDVQSFAAKLITQSLPPADESLEQLFAKWDAEDPVTGPEDLEARRAEGEAFMQSLAQSRRDMEGPNARQLWP